MKKILFLFGVLAIGFTGCKNCGTCTYETRLPNPQTLVIETTQYSQEYCGKDWRTMNKNAKANTELNGFLNLKCKGNGLF